MVSTIGLFITPQIGFKAPQNAPAPNVLLENKSGSPLSQDLTEEEEKVVRELKKTDQEVRAHEQTHKNIAGPYAGPISYETTTGPDGREYAVSGSVDIDTSPIPGNPRATIQKMDIIIRAALAPSDPSPEDFAVARSAQQARLQAQKEVREQEEVKRAETQGTSSTPIQALIEEATAPITPSDFSRIIENYTKATNLRSGLLLDIQG